MEQWGCATRRTRRTDLVQECYADEKDEPDELLWVARGDDGSGGSERQNLAARIELRQWSHILWRVAQRDEGRIRDARLAGWNSL